VLAHCPRVGTLWWMDQDAGTVARTMIGLGLWMKKMKKDGWIGVPAQLEVESPESDDRRTSRDASEARRSDGAICHSFSPLGF
jgi:hypothetical protein